MIFALIFIFVANPEYEECEQSKLVTEAFTRPIEDYEAILPDRTVTQNYIRDLKSVRGDLEDAEVQILNRNEAGLDSAVELPAWAFTRYNATPFVRDNGPSLTAIMEDPLTILRHVRYLYNLNQFVLETPRRWSLEDFTFESHLNTRTIRNRVTQQWQDRFKNGLEPYPRPALLILDSRIRETVQVPYPDRIVTHSTEQYIFSPLEDEDIFEMMDMGTGILNLEEE